MYAIRSYYGIYSFLMATVLVALDAVDVGMTEAAGEIASLESEDVCLAEIILSPRSTIAGHTLTQLRFRERFGMNVVSSYNFV